MIRAANILFELEKPNKLQKQDTTKLFPETFLFLRKLHCEVEHRPVSDRKTLLNAAFVSLFLIFMFLSSSRHQGPTKGFIDTTELNNTVDSPMKTKLQ